MIHRERLVYAYFLFLMLWFGFVFALVKFIGISVLEALGIGTASGIFLAAFKDMWQFIWRKASSAEETAASQPPVPK